MSVAENLVNNPEHVAPDRVAHVTQQSSTALEGVGANPPIPQNPIDESTEKQSTVKEAVSDAINKTIDAVKETIDNIVGVKTDTDKKADDSKTNGESKEDERKS
ncbi:33413_t:CDS:2 [Racocetra persica]|uniref:33413_t:CDS:1 n=1 Tax=Racocetra persica TaxID=160502 RepID=A0ACA9NQJ2_9GLOM|nr:33413_t:CDS:2 [Racocetra persica]